VRLENGELDFNLIQFSSGRRASKSPHLKKRGEPRSSKIKCNDRENKTEHTVTPKADCRRRDERSAGSMHRKRDVKE